MKLWGNASNKCIIPLNFLRLTTNKTNAQGLNGNPNPPEILQIPQLFDENGRDLLSERVSTEMLAIERKWSNYTLRRFDSYWNGPARSQPPHQALERSCSAQSSASSRDKMSSQRRYLSPDTGITDRNSTPSDRPPQAWDIRDHSPQLFCKPATRFYRPQILPEKLLGPENYKHWTLAMERTLRECGIAWGLEGDVMLALVYGEIIAQWARFNPNIWMVIFSNVSPQIQEDLRGLETLDAGEAWQFLEKTCGGDVLLRARSVKGVRDIMNVRYDKCSSLKEYLRKMMLCIRAIECNPHGEKENQRREGGNHGGRGNEGTENEWLWCQLILVNLGPEWESWVSELLEKSKDGEPMADAMSNLRRLFHVIEVEEARRIQASRYTRFPSEE
ncbi:unnamed protein product [Penicillium olsonii]|nr:unnamed protein product [Penicillium olsonii]